MGDLQAAERLCSAPDSGAEYCDDRVCVFVCLRAYLRHPIFTKLFMYVTYAHGSVLLWWRRVVICYVLPVSWMTSYLRISQGSSTWPPS